MMKVKLQKLRLKQSIANDPEVFNLRLLPLPPLFLHLLLLISSIVLLLSTHLSNLFFVFLNITTGSAIMVGGD